MAENEEQRGVFFEFDYVGQYSEQYKNYTGHFRFKHMDSNDYPVYEFITLDRREVRIRFLGGTWIIGELGDPRSEHTFNGFLISHDPDQSSEFPSPYAWGPHSGPSSMDEVSITNIIDPRIPEEEEEEDTIVVYNDIKVPTSMKVCLFILVVEVSIIAILNIVMII